jgi:hypothetical protein
MVTKPGAIKTHLDRLDGAFVLATPSYGTSALLAYHLGKRVIVFGAGSHHGRQDDLLTDFRILDGGNVLILRTAEPRTDEYAAFFREVSVERTQVDGASFHLVRGRGFRYASYKDAVLREIARKYYDIPPWLPVAPDGGFLGRYGLQKGTGS